VARVRVRVVRVRVRVRIEPLAARVSSIASAMPKMRRSGSWPTSSRTPGKGQGQGQG
jgi:hypothetical protein